MSKAKYTCMKALRSIGIKKAVQFVFFGMYSGLLRLVLFPQLRVILMRLAGARIGNDTIIYDTTFSNLYHYGFKKLTIGDRVFIGDEVMLDCRGGIVLEDDVTLSNRTNIVSHINVGYDDHPLQKKYPTKESVVTIKKGAYIGTGAIVLPGVTIGKNAVVAAGSVVTKSVKSSTLVAGVPAVKKKVVGSR